MISKKNAVKKRIIIFIIIFVSLILAILSVIYLTRRDIVGKSWYYFENDMYHVMYHGIEYIEIKNMNNSFFTNGKNSVLSNELLMPGRPELIGYFLPKIMYGRVVLIGKGDYPKYIELHYAWDGGTIYLKRKD